MQAENNTYHLNFKPLGVSKEAWEHHNKIMAELARMGFKPNPVQLITVPTEIPRPEIPWPDYYPYPETTHSPR